jgi:transketolase
MDGEVSNSTYADAFEEAYPQRYFEAYIAECQLIATAVGMSVRHYRPFASTFAAFVARAYDFIRMAAVSRANIVICGSHAGVEIGADGPSQMALEDLAALRAVHGSTVLYPADATACTQLVGAAADLDGIVYLRTTRGAYPVLYPPEETFAVGGSKLLRSGAGDVVTIVGAGVTVHSALAAADELAAGGIGARVIDAYSVKPIDAAALRAAAESTGGRLIVVEDHHPEGGLGAAVLEALAADDALTGLHLEHLAVRTMPGSATSAQQLAAAGIDADAIVAAARRLLAQLRRPSAN